MAEVREGEQAGRSPLRREGLADDVLAVAAGALARWRGAGRAVTIVALDGHGASGKTTIAQQLCAVTGASLVHTDDFFSTDAASRERSGNRTLASYYDVSRLRREALEPLKAGREAVFHPYDWEAGALSHRQVRVAPTDLVVLEGVYSAARLLADLVDKAIYVKTPEPERLGRLQGRVAPDEWDSEWLRAEQEYFSAERTGESFDLVIRGSSTAPPVPRGARAPVEGRRAGHFSPHPDSP
jgi:uridine kinase